MRCQAKKTLEVCLWLVFWEIYGPPYTKMGNCLHDESLALFDSSVLHRHCPLVMLRCSSVPASEEYVSVYICSLALGVLITTL